MIDLSKLDPNRREAFEERAAIMEYLAGMPREKAETMAAERLGLTPKPKPAQEPLFGR